MTQETTRTEPLLSEGQRDRGLGTKSFFRKQLGLLGGVAIAIAVFLLLPESLSYEGRVTAAVAVLMGAWWVTEAVPIPVTALLPLIIYPLTKAGEIPDLAGSYANPIIFLLLGGFILAGGLERWNLHRRIALRIVLVIGTRPSRLIAGFMIATAFLSMWVSNSATATMMIPMGMSLVTLVNERRKDLQKESHFGVALMLGVAYAATCGGLGTMIGSPVNVIVVGYLRETLERDITFLQWMCVGVPVMVMMLVIGWLILTKWVWRPEVDELPGGEKLFRGLLDEMGPMSGGEKLTLLVFGLAAASWMFIPILFPDSPADDAVIAMCAALAMFLIPAASGRGVMLMDWRTATRIPWDVLILVGGGLALSSQIISSGLSEWIGGLVGNLDFLPFWAMIVLITVMLLLLTEFTSNTATSAAFVPVVGGLAAGMGADPLILVIAAGIACSLAFMLPVGTPPNAIAFGSGAVTIPQMVRSGIWMNVAGVVVVVISVLTFVPWVLS